MAKYKSYFALPFFQEGAKKMILITGGNGQLGTELRHLLDEQGIEYVSTDSTELDITDADSTLAKVKEIQPSVIYHCAAYTAVDKAEDEGKELDEKVNVDGTRHVAEAAKAVGATLVYVSTDYIFDGTKKEGVYAIDDQPNPLNEYGRTKLLGEQAVQEILDDYYIIRTSWVFGQYGHNFVFTMQKLAETRDQLTVVDDQFGRPTWTRTLAEFMAFVIAEKAPFGVYHLSNENSCSWYQFAKEILKDTEVEVLQYSVMDLSKTEALGFKIPTWQEALAQMLENVQQ